MATRARSLLLGSTLTLLAAIVANACSAGSDANPSGSSSGSGGNSSASGTSSSSATGAGGDIDLDGGATGSGGLTPDGACASLSSEAELGLAPADIIIAVDTSGSMSEESNEVQQNLNTFAALITASGIDVHVILVADGSVCIPAPLGSGQCGGADELLPGYQHVVQTVNSTDGLSVLLSTYPQWKSSLRAGATKTFLMVSDDDSDLDAASFTQQLLALDPPTFQGFKFDAIVSSEGPGVCTACFFACASCQSACCDKTQLCVPLSAAEGKVYKTLVSQTGGILGDLCTQDFAPTFQDMATGVVLSTTVSCVFDIPAAPDGGVFDPQKVNVNYTPGGGMAQPVGYVPGGAAACGPSGGWYYDSVAAPTQILLCPSTCTAVQGDPNGKIEVLFGCDTIEQPPE
jgi:hypothetical protein